MTVKVCFGLLSAPFVFIPALISNLTDAICSIIKNCALSYARNISATFNLLGDNGVMGPRQELADDRGMPAKVIFGILSSPLVAISALVTNVIDIVAAFFKNTALSFTRNLRASYNVLGDIGVMGLRQPLVDNRSMPAKVIFGIISAPLVLIPALFTNLIDAACSFIKHIALSFVRNLNVTFNLLGENGVMGPRRALEDDRSLLAKVTFGILSAPILLVPALVSNIVDVFATFCKQVALSFVRNLRATFNLLGDNGVMGVRRGSQDERGLPTKIIFGIISAPLVVVCALITNMVDGVCSFIKNLCLSFHHNLRSTFNLLGQHGIMGARRPYADERGRPAKVIYGMLTAPLVLIPALITNLIDGIAAYFKNARVTILKPIKISSMLAGGAVLVAASLPVFLIIKTIKAAWNCTGRLIRDKIDDQPFVGILRVMERIANLATCGVFSAGKKIFFNKPTGYTHRFGFPADLAENASVFNSVQSQFNQAINHAKSGTFPGIIDPRGTLRGYFRTVLHFRHTCEKALKALHDAYLTYKRDIPDLVDDNDQRLSMHSFFSSPARIVFAKANVEIRQGEEQIFDVLQRHLLPAI